MIKSCTCPNRAVTARQRWLSVAKPCLVTLLLILPLAAAEEDPPEHVRNFGQVNDKVWRGGQPTPIALHELKDRGVSLILNLREHGDIQEKSQVESLGMQYEHLPLRSITAPKPTEIERALSILLRRPNDRTYVHCWRGKDRTGTVIACYRIQHDSWPNARALAEAKTYGMSHLEFAMQSFIMRFRALDLSNLLALPASQ